MNASGRISPEWDSEALHLLREKSWKNTITCLKADEGIKTSSSDENENININNDWDIDYNGDMMKEEL